MPERPKPEGLAYLEAKTTATAKTPKNPVLLVVNVLKEMVWDCIEVVEIFGVDMWIVISTVCGSDYFRCR